MGLKISHGLFHETYVKRNHMERRHYLPYVVEQGALRDRAQEQIVHLETWRTTSFNLTLNLGDKTCDKLFDLAHERVPALPRLMPLTCLVSLKWSTTKRTVYGSLFLQIMLNATINSEPLLQLIIWNAQPFMTQFCHDEIRQLLFSYSNFHGNPHALHLTSRSSQTLLVLVTTHSYSDIPTSPR